MADLGGFQIADIFAVMDRKITLTITCPVNQSLLVRQTVEEIRAALQGGKAVKLTAQTVTKKRSLSQNAYAWLLIDRLAAVLKASPDEIYEQLLDRYGVHAVYAVPAGAAEIVRKHERCVRELGTHLLRGEPYTSFRVVVGSSKYDTEQMSAFLDGIIAECREQGVATEAEGWEGV